jgi:hypothetical protein
MLFSDMKEYFRKGAKIKVIPKMSFSRKMKSSQKTFLILIFSGALFLIYSFRYEISLKILIFGTKIDLF